VLGRALRGRPVPEQPPEPAGVVQRPQQADGPGPDPLRPPGRLSRRGPDPVTAATRRPATTTGSVPRGHRAAAPQVGGGDDPQHPEPPREQILPAGKISTPPAFSPRPGRGSGGRHPAGGRKRPRPAWGAGRGPTMPCTPSHLARARGRVPASF